MEDTKPTVFYEPINTFVLAIGQQALVKPVDHPQAGLNGKPTFTSRVVSIQPNGDFETINTSYVRNY